LQAKAEHAVGVGVKAMSSQGVNNGMMLAARPSTGEILAWVGSADFNNAAIGGQFDVIRSPRQPGSSFKPYVYEAALRAHKITLASFLVDQPTNFNGYQPLDFDNSYMGQLSARQALVLSRNIPAVEVAQQEGITNVISLAQQMGIKSPLQPYLSTAIGGSEVTMLDHLQGYQVFADEGRKVPLMSITRITGSGGQTLFEQSPGRQDGQQQVLSAAEAYLLTDTLKAYQNQWHLGWKQQMASKSGTSGASQVGVHQDSLDDGLQPRPGHRRVGRQHRGERGRQHRGERGRQHHQRLRRQHRQHHARRFHQYPPGGPQPLVPATDGSDRQERRALPARDRESRHRLRSHGRRWWWRWRW